MDGTTFSRNFSFSLSLSPLSACFSMTPLSFSVLSSLDSSQSLSLTCLSASLLTHPPRTIVSPNDRKKTLQMFPFVAEERSCIFEQHLSSPVCVVGIYVCMCCVCVSVTANLQQPNFVIHHNTIHQHSPLSVLRMKTSSHV